MAFKVGDRVEVTDITHENSTGFINLGMIGVITEIDFDDIEGDYQPYWVKFPHEEGFIAVCGSEITAIK